MEHTRTISDFPNYSIREDGKIYNNLTGREVLPSFNNSRILRVNILAPDGTRTNRSVALLVARTFLPRPTEPEDTPIHKDGNYANVHVDNLAWRPRWYAIMYHRQFRRPHRIRITEPIMNTDTREVFDGSLEAATHYGVLEKDVIMNVYAARVSVPVIWQNFELVRDLSGLS